jgi:divalent metal cation (Fe/Co/Zn/Cd) transporter
MVLAPEQLLVAAHFDVSDELSGDQVEQLTDEIEADLRRAVPSVAYVFLDPSPRRTRARARAA